MGLPKNCASIKKSVRSEFSRVTIALPEILATYLNLIIESFVFWPRRLRSIKFHGDSVLPNFTATQFCQIQWRLYIVARERGKNYNRSNIICHVLCKCKFIYFINSNILKLRHSYISHIFSFFYCYCSSIIKLMIKHVARLHIVTFYDDLYCRNALHL